MTEILTEAPEPTDELAKNTLNKIVRGGGLEPPEHKINLTPEEQAVLEDIEAPGRQASVAWHKQQKRDARRVLPEALR